MADAIRKRMRLIDVSAATVLVLAVTSTVLFGIVPVSHRMRAEKNEAGELCEKLAKLDGLSHTLVQVESELASTQSRLAQAEARLPSSGAMDEFMVQLAKVAEETGLQVDSVLPKAVQEGSNYRVMPVAISGTGSWETCYQFLTGLRKMNRLTRLDDVVLQVENNGLDREHPEAKPVCRIGVGISTFIAR